ncbi:hypothetical protein [Vibrio sp. 1180_3]|uniref:hypothetical protein n=1 Tax=Vibrio sp. 1180_3 TaxID=2528832 RepID=UPI0024055E05|nr:hypothetical protein [Vibrio sp. 1180_3]MDF9399146.1 hypothetical protein [Vibrio sp. 1180_3]
MLYTITANQYGLTGMPIFIEKQVQEVLNVRGIICMTRYQAELAIEYLSQPVFVFGSATERWKELCVIKKSKNNQYIVAIEDKLSLFEEITNYAKTRLEFILESEHQNLNVNKLNVYSMDIDAFDIESIEIRYLTPNKFSVISTKDNRKELVAAYELSHEDALMLTYLP